MIPSAGHDSSSTSRARTVNGTLEIRRGHAVDDMVTGRKQERDEDDDGLGPRKCAKCDRKQRGPEQDLVVQDLEELMNHRTRMNTPLCSEWRSDDDVGNHVLEERKQSRKKTDADNQLPRRHP
jgi:hypothetical protein